MYIILLYSHPSPIPYRAVGGVPTSVFYPVLTWLLLLILFIYWAVVAVYPTFVVYKAQCMEICV